MAGLTCSYHHGNRVSPVYARHLALGRILDASAMPRMVMLVNWNQCFVCIKRDPTVIERTANWPKKQLLIIGRAQNRCASSGFGGDDFNTCSKKSGGALTVLCLSDT
jgi:hypothetical protein